MKLKNKIRKAYFSMFLSRGDDYFCVFCEKSFSQFLPSGSDREILRRYEVVGAGRRSNAICPNCFSKHRGRLLYLYFRERTDVFSKPHRLLHIAPDENLADALHGAETIDYICGGLDISTLSRFDAVKIDVTDIPFGDAEFDIVLCNHVMVYVIDEARGFAEIRRVLKPGGYAILQQPIALALQETLEIPDDIEINRKNGIKFCGHGFFVRLYGLDYEEKLRHYGFDVTRHNAFKENWMPEMRRHGLDPREEIFVAVKR